MRHIVPIMALGHRRRICVTSLIYWMLDAVPLPVELLLVLRLMNIASRSRIEARRSVPLIVHLSTQVVCLRIWLLSVILVRVRLLKVVMLHIVNFVIAGVVHHRVALADSVDVIWLLVGGSRRCVDVVVSFFAHLEVAHAHFDVVLGRVEFTDLDVELLIVIFLSILVLVVLHFSL